MSPKLALLDSLLLCSIMCMKYLFQVYLRFVSLSSQGNGFCGHVTFVAFYQLRRLQQILIFLLRCPFVVSILRLAQTLLCLRLICPNSFQGSSDWFQFQESFELMLKGHLEVCTRFNFRNQVNRILENR